MTSQPFLQLEDDERPSYGPHVFVTPSNAFTSFHQDNYGSVDSIHYCHSGVNEVVMLPRLSKDDKVKALNIYFEKVLLFGKEKKLVEATSLNVLVSLPHADENVSFLTNCLC